MKKIVTLALITMPCFAQTVIPIKDLAILDNYVFEAIKPYQIIWIGEMHGANEPAQFAGSIVDLLLKNKKKVTFGFEIKESDLPVKKDSLSLVKSTFGKTYQNRATCAWLNLVLKMDRNNLVKTFYFDENNEGISNEERDSLMAVNILDKWDHNSTLVLLSGNLHNMQEPRNDSKKAALQLLEMTNGAYKTLSLNHSFRKGQIYAGSTDENGNPKFIDFDFTSSKKLQNEMYNTSHLFISPSLKNGWNGHFYTEFVTPSAAILAN